MKLQTKPQQWLLPVAVGLALATSASVSRAQTVQDYIVGQFDDGIGGGLWSPNYGAAPMTIEYDPLQDRGPGANPGAMKCVINFNLCSSVVQRDFERVMADTLDLTKYTKVHFSVKVDPSSSHLSDWGGGAFGNMRFHVRKSDWSGDSNIGKDDGTSQQWVGSDAYGTWKDYAVAIDQTTALGTKAATKILGIDIWSGWGNCAAPIGHTNTVTFWIDNIWFEFNTNTAPPTPPTIAMQKPGAQGVQITVDENGNQWQRDAIASPSTPGNCFWNGYGATPVTYSFTIAEFPNPVAHEGFEAHLYVGNTDTAGGTFNETYGGCDWNVADIAVVSLLSNTNGSFDISFYWKTNLPNANPLTNAIYHPATMTNLPSALGTWVLTFTDNTNVTLSGPSGASTNFTIPEAAVLNNFSPAASFLQFGFHKNDNENDGHNNQEHGTFSRIKKTGGDFQFDDRFDGPAYTSHYAWRKTSATAVQHVPPGTAWNVSWTSPADQYNLESAPGLSGPWAPPAASSTYQSAGKLHAIIPAASLPSANSTYFRMVKRPFVKLQVLMPGETNAPYTLSGKVGTPDPQVNGTAFNVTVNAVDVNWHRVTSDLYNRYPSTDTVKITSSDATATLPADAAMVAGTATFSVTFNASGNHTVTATDVTNGAKLPNTGSPTTVP